jgi:hypothetical protein
MINANDDFDKENPQRKSQASYVVPEQDIRTMIGGLRIHKTHDVTLRLSAAALAVVESMQNHVSAKSNESIIHLLRQLTKEYKNKQYQDLMNAVIAAIESDKDTMNSAYLTLARALEFVNGSIAVHSSARQFYEERMSDITKAKDND